MKMNKQLYKRLSEPSTYAGMAGLAVALGLSADEWQTYSTALVAVFGALAILLGEKGEK